MTEFKEFDSVAVVTLMRCENAKRGTLIDPVLGDFREQTDEALNEFLSAENIQNGFKILDDLLFHITGYKGEVHSVHYEYPETVFYLQMGAKFLKKIFPEIYSKRSQHLCMFPRAGLNSRRLNTFHQIYGILGAIFFFFF